MKDCFKVTFYGHVVFTLLLVLTFNIYSVFGNYNSQPQPQVFQKNQIQNREHLKEHLGGVLSEPDLSKMSEDELQFHYFKLHDSDNNNKLDGCELIKSLFHYHAEEHKNMPQNAHQASGTTKIFTDQDLINMIDPIMELDDRDRNGFIDYAEFVSAQKSRGF